MGFKVFEAINGKTLKLSSDLNLTIYAADNCNPELCYKFIGCADLSEKNSSQHFDSVAVFDNNLNVVVNVNDCPYRLALNTISSIKKKFGKIDLLLTGYSGAGEFPQCFDNFNEQEKKIEAHKKKLNFLNQAIQYIQFLEPCKYFLFAGRYTLSGKLFKLNKFRGIPNKEESRRYIERNINVNSVNLNLNEECIFDIEKNKLFNLKNVLHTVDDNHFINKGFVYDHDKVPTIDDLIILGEKAFVEFDKRSELLNLKRIHKLCISLGEKHIIIGEDFKISETLPTENYLRIATDPKLLARLFMGPKFAHWNNASIGSHIRFYRKPNIYERSTYYSLSYLHA